MKHIYTLATLLLCFTSILNAQIPYGVYEVPFQPLSLSQAQVLALGDDNTTNAIPIGFTFSYFGVPYTSLAITSNAYITFDSNQFGSMSDFSPNQHIPDPTAPVNAIFLAWCDLNPMVSGVVKYEIVGQSPNRVFVIEYDQVPYFGCQQSLFTGQIHLFEGSNNIEMHIVSKPLCSTGSNWGDIAIQGIQNTIGTEGFHVPGRNNVGSWQAFNDAWRFDPDTVSQPACIMGGSVIADFNGNCILDEADYAIPGQVLIRDQGLAFTTTNSSGAYSFEADTGVYQIGFNGLQSSLPFAQIACPTDGFYSVNFQTAGSIDNSLNFFVHPDSSCADIRSSISPLGPLRKCSGNTNHQMVSISNHGLLPVFGYSVTVDLPDSMSIMYTVPPFSSQDGNSLTWVFSDTLVYGEFTTIQLYDTLDCYTTNLTSKCISVTVTSGSDCNLNNNESQVCQLVNGSYDPNHIQVKSFNSNQYVYDSPINGNEQWFTYKVEFQNTGTAPAQTVVITDVLPSFFDYSSAEIMASSHTSFLVNLGDGTLKFVYNNIALVDSSEDYLGSIGSVVFRVKSLYNLLPGQEVANQASIVFDVNEPIITNEAFIRVELPSSIETLNSGVSLYPNPANNLLYINNSTNATCLMLISDLSGKTVLSSQVNSGQTHVQLTDISSGVYLVELFQGNTKISNQKLVISKN
jgi:uncharacterized repeat protein (TIGR01451 family)